MREGGPRELQPWEYAGWFVTAADWIETKLPATVRVDQYSTWCVSSLHRVETASGRYYFKAAPTIFRHEASVTEMLAERFPETIPRPIAIESERGWFLTADFGDELVATMDAPHREGALNALVTLQPSSVASVESLLRSGCFDRRPRVLQRQVEELGSGGFGVASERDGYATTGGAVAVPRPVRGGRERAHPEHAGAWRLPRGKRRDERRPVPHLRLDGRVYRTPIRRRRNVPAQRRILPRPIRQPVRVGATTTFMDGKISPLAMWRATCSNAWGLSRRCIKRSRTGRSWTRSTRASAGSSGLRFTTGSPGRWLSFALSLNGVAIVI